MDRKKKIVANCDICMYYEYDDEYDCYTCDMEYEMDEDDVWQMMSGDRERSCPFFRMGDEYKIVHKQI